MSAPRRARAQWLDGDCPSHVLAIFDNGGRTWDRYTILYVPAEGQDWITYFVASAHPFDPQGFGQHGELRLHEARAYRYRETGAGHSTRWTDLPADVQRAVREDAPEVTR